MFKFLKGLVTTVYDYVASFFKRKPQVEVIEVSEEKVVSETAKVGEVVDTTTPLSFFNELCQTTYHRKWLPQWGMGLEKIIYEPSICGPSVYDSPNNVRMLVIPLGLGNLVLCPAKIKDTTQITYHVPRAFADFFNKFVFESNVATVEEMKKFIGDTCSNLSLTRTTRAIQTMLNYAASTLGGGVPLNNMLDVQDQPSQPLPEVKVPQVRAPRHEPMDPDVNRTRPQPQTVEQQKFDIFDNPIPPYNPGQPQRTGFDR